MSNTIKPKRSYTTSVVPSGLSAGELAINAADGKVWIGSALGANVLVASLSLSDMKGSTTNITEGSNLFYTDSRSRLALSAGTGISYDNTTGVITNSSPDQTVVLTAGTGISTSGTYPNFTITNSSPDQTVKLTSGTGISITGTYPDFTITNSSPSGGGTVTSVGLTAPTGMKVTGSPVTGSGTLALAMDTGYTLPTTASQTNWDAAYTNRITSLTTTGSSGSATLVSNTLNVPTYTLAGLGGQASSTNLTSLSGLTYSSASFVKMTSSGTFSLDTATYLTENQSITLSGDASGSGTTSIAVTLATVSATKGGTGQTSYDLGDILYCSASNVLSKLAGNTTSAKQFLVQTGNGSASAAPEWAGLASADVTAALGFTPASPGGSSGEFQYKNASGGFSGTSALQFQATAFEDIRVYGTSTSRVPFSIYVPNSTGFNWFEINSVNSVNYVTIDNLGHLNLFQGNLNNYNNVVFTNSNTNRTITLARPSTFAASYTLTLPTSAGTNGQVLLSGGGASPLQWGNSVSNLNGGDGFTLKGSIPYQSDVNTTTLLSPNTTTTRKFLRQTGTGTNGAAPAWDTLTSSDIGLGNVENTAISTWAGSTNITTVGAVTTRNLAVVPVASTGSPSPSVTVTAPAHTALTASTESNDLNINLARTAQFATGALATQRAIRIQPPTYSAVGASVITNASTVSIDNPPAAGSNVTITNPAALNVGTSNGVGIIISGVQNQSYDLFRANITNIDSTTFISTTRSAITISSGGQLVLNPTNSGVGNTNQLRFLELAANGTNYVGFKGADNIASNVIWTLPSADGTSGQVLSTNGSGTLSWTTASSGSSIPSGSMQMYAGSVTQSASSGVVTTNAPSGWLLCNGDIVSRTTYSALFTAIGTTYGAGDGSTTFALPDMRSRVPVGVGQASGLSNRTLGGTVGEENTTIGSTNLPAHSHSFSPTGTLNTESSHTHASPNAGFHAHGSNVNVLCYAAGGANLNAGTTFQHYNLNQIMYGAGDHGHGNTNSNSGHTHTFTPTAGQTTGNGPGTGASLTNMQPSIGLNYIIKT